MRTQLLGLELTHALRLLEQEGRSAQITITCAPRQADREGVLRVVYADDNAEHIIASRFLDPVAGVGEGE